MNVAASQMQVSALRLMVDPEFYLFNYAANEHTSEFLIVDEGQLEEAPFIDTRFERFARGQFSISTRQLAELDDHLPRPRPRQFFIFHHAFVCSTLLARCLARSDAFFSLKEPHILRRLSDLKSAGLPPHAAGTDRWGGLVRTHLRLLAKNYSNGHSVVVKASNVANNLIDDILVHSDARLVYLHGPLKDFLVSNLRKPLATREKIPWLLLRVLGYTDLAQRLPRFQDTTAMSFLQQCALLWLASHYQFLSHAGSRADRARTLALEPLLDDPRRTLAQVSSWFGHAAGATDLDRMTAPDLLQRHAKDPNQPYDAGLRRQEFAAMRTRYGAAIDRTAAWLEPAVRELGIAPSLAALAL